MDKIIKSNKFKAEVYFYDKNGFLKYIRNYSSILLAHKEDKNWEIKNKGNYYQIIST